jgi:hypothetical protein
MSAFDPKRTFRRLFLKLHRTQLMAVVAFARGNSVTFLAHVSPCAEAEAVLYEGFGRPASAVHPNDTLVTLTTAISDSNGIPVWCDEDA